MFVFRRKPQHDSEYIAAAPTPRAPPTSPPPPTPPQNGVDLQQLGIFLALLLACIAIPPRSNHGAITASGASLAARQADLEGARMYWSKWIETQGLDNPEEFQQRTRTREIDEKIKSLLNPEARAGRGTVRILDVGAGPMTSIGSAWVGKVLDLRACDPLAAEFDKLLSTHKIVPPVRTVFAEHENLSRVFATKFFDLVLVHNAVVKSHDPVLVLKEALMVTRINGTVWLGQRAHTGLNDGYLGSHKWNVDLWDGHPIIWNAHALHNLTEVFDGNAVVASKSSGDRIELLLIKLG